MADMRPSDLRVLMEQEARRQRDDLRAQGVPAAPSMVAALVMESLQSVPSVNRRMEMLWRYVEDFVRDLDATGG